MINKKMIRRAMNNKTMTKEAMEQHEDDQGDSKIAKEMGKTMNNKKTTQETMNNKRTREIMSNKRTMKMMSNTMVAS
jgi:hypothetical protein